MRLNKPIQEILSEYREELNRLLGNQFHSIVLYGSHARGDDRETSDIDVLCVIKGPFNYGEMILKTGEAAAAISLKYDVVLSTTFATRADFENRNTPFLMNLRREAVPV
jgi:predicted nucleotidyltransferase